MAEHEIYKCEQCGTEAPARLILGGPLKGEFLPPAGWESETFIDPEGARHNGPLERKVWCCSRECRGRWVFLTAKDGYRQP